jgi:ABC-type transport system substrate-binding protein
MKTLLLVGIFSTMGVMHITEIKTQELEPVINGDIFKVEWMILPQTPLDPATNQDDKAAGLNSLICESLYDYDGNSLIDVVPALASALPEISGDGLRYNITLRQGVYFSDGTEFNAWVYKYSLDRVLLISDPQGPANLLKPLRGAETALNYTDINATEAYDYLAQEAVKVLSDYRIEINLAYQYVPIIKVLTTQVGCAVSPKAVIENIPVTFAPNETNNDTGMIDLAKWFPVLAGNYSKLGLPNLVDSTYSGIIPSGIVKTNSPAQHTWFINHQIGTGPWIIDGINATTIKLSKNINWWNNNSYAINSPTKIVIRIEPNANKRGSHLISGDVDVIDLYYNITDTLLYGNGTSKIATVKSYVFPDLSYNIIGFNQRLPVGFEYLYETYPGSSSDWENDTSLFNAGLNGYNHLQNNASTDNPLTVLKMRKAFCLIFNYTGYLDDLTGGLGERLEGLIPLGLFGHQSNLISDHVIPENDSVAAKALFQEVGWEGGMRGGYTMNQQELDFLAFINLKKSVLELNIKVDLLPLIIDNQYEILKFELVKPFNVLETKNLIADPDEQLRKLFYGKNSIFSKYFNYHNPELDGMIDAAVVESNPTTRQALYSSIEHYIAEESILIYGFQKNKVLPIWYQWNDFVESGSVNPMRLFPRVQFMSKIEQLLPCLTNCNNITTPTSEITTTTTTNNNTTTIPFTDIFDPLFDKLLLIGATSVSILVISSIIFNNRKKIKNDTKNTESMNEKYIQNPTKVESKRIADLEPSIKKVKEMLDEFSK